MQEPNQQKKYQSLPLISFSEERGYILEEEGISFLKSLPESESYAVMTIVGKAKTGKSFLFNQLLKKRMFPTSSCLNNCSKGIRISTQIIRSNGLNTIVLDTEGLGSIEGSDDRDCKIFILSLLLSSVLLYNSTGTIDEQTLNNLSMIIQVVKVFEKELQNSSSLPGLFWVLRDFTLKMQDKNGFPITPKQYLQSSLEEQKGSSQIIYHKNRIRRIIKTLFTQRMCQTLVIPSQQITMKQTQEVVLRQQFLDDLKKMENKLKIMLNKKGQKKICNIKMSPESFINAARVYVDNFNRSLEDGSMPKIQNLTYQLREKQAKNCRQKFKETLENCREAFIEEICELRLNSQPINAKSQELKIIQKMNELFENSRSNLLQLTGKLQDQQLYQIKSQFSDNLYKQCENKVKNVEEQRQKQVQEMSGIFSEQQITNICEYLTHITNEEQLQKQYTYQIEQIKHQNIDKSPIEFSNILMKLQLSYLRRKLELTKQININKEKLVIELDYAKKEIVRLQQRNKDLQEEMLKQVKEISFSTNKMEKKQTYLTPLKQENRANLSQKKNNTYNKTQEWNASERKPLSNVQSSAKNDSSPFFVPYIVLENSYNILTKIVRTLIKEDSKKNQYIQYVIQVNILGQKWIVNRKFKDFSELNNILFMMFQNSDLPECESIINPKPIDNALHNRKECVEQRRRELEDYVGNLLEIECVRNSRIMQKFLKINKQYSMI